MNVNGRTDHIAERHNSNWHGDWDRRHAHFDHGHFFVFVGGFWCGLDAGFFPWDYLPYYTDDYYPYDYYTADVPQYDNENTEAVDNGVPVADPTVQAVQTQLTQLGYYNGPADGFFGPATRDAVAKYQIARNLTVTGSLSLDMLQSLGLATGNRELTCAELLDDESHTSTVGENGTMEVGAHSDAHFQLVGLNGRARLNQYYSLLFRDSPR